MPYDPTLYRGCARHYAVGRPPYSRTLAPALRAELGLDGSGRLLDVGCGPGKLALELAPLFEEAVGLDPDADMLVEAARLAREGGIANVRWIRAVAEDIPTLGLGRFRLVGFAQSFHWTDRERVAEAVYDLLEPGGAIALIANTVEGRPQPAGTGHPPIPHDALRAIAEHYLGPRKRAGQGFSPPPRDRFEDALRRTRFGEPRILFCEGRPDVVRDTESVLAGQLSLSWCAPHLFADRLASFEADVRAELARCSPSGLFWDWPGDTEVVLGRKPG